MLISESSYSTASYDSWTDCKTRVFEGSYSLSMKIFVKVKAYIVMGLFYKLFIGISHSHQSKELVEVFLDWLIIIRWLRFGNAHGKECGS